MKSSSRPVRLQWATERDVSCFLCVLEADNLASIQIRSPRSVVRGYNFAKSRDACDGRRGSAQGLLHRGRGGVNTQYTIHNKFGPLFRSVDFFPGKPQDSQGRDSRVTINRPFINV